MIEELAIKLKEIGLDPSAEELADMLWLTSQMGALPFRESNHGTNRTSGENERRKRPSYGGRANFETEIRAGTQSPNLSNTQLDNQTNAYLSTAGEKDKSQADTTLLPIHLPTANALPNALKLGRTLRPLKRRVASPRDKILNEAETVRQSAESDSLQLVFQPAQEASPGVILLIDESASMILWRETINEFRLLLERLGAFRTHETWYFTADQSDRQMLNSPPPVVATKDGSSRKSQQKTPLTDREILIFPTRQALASGRDGRKPKQVASLERQFLILVLSDCIGQAWYSGRASKLLTGLGASNPVGLVQMLPEYLWEQTALGEATFCYVKAPVRATPNARLQSESSSRWQSHPYRLPKIATPILTLEQASLFAWESLVSGKQLGGSPAVRIPIEDTYADKPNPSDLELNKTTAEEHEQLLHRFYARATPQAQELASYLAAMPVLSLPLMRIVQRQMVEESTSAHLAEVLYSGLFTYHTSYAQTLRADDIRFEMDDQIRYRLFDTLWVDAAIKVIKLVWDKVSAFISNILDKLITFDAFIENPEAITTAHLTSNLTPFAEITCNLLRRVDNKHARAADILQKRIKAQLGTNESGLDSSQHRPQGKTSEKISQVEIDKPLRLTYNQTPPHQRLSRHADLNRVFQIIQYAIDKGNSNTKRLLFLEGDAGVGKTVLLGDLQHFLREHEPDWRVLGIYDAQTFASNHPFARFIELMNGCAGKILLKPLNPLEITLEEIIRCANLLELELTNRFNEPLILMFDELERWLDIEGEERETLNHLFRIVWRVLLRQAAMPCVIVCAGRRLPVFRDVLLRRTLETIPLQGFSPDELQHLITKNQDPLATRFILDRANGNPWVAQLLAYELKRNPEELHNSPGIKQLLRRVFDYLLDGRLSNELADILFTLSYKYPDGFDLDAVDLPEGDITIARLVRSSFVYFDSNSGHYRVTPVLYALLHPTEKEFVQ